MTQEDVAQLAASLVLERVARRLYNAGAVDELRCLSRMSAQEIDILVELERADAGCTEMSHRGAGLAA